MDKGVEINKEELKNFYENEKLTTYQIAKKLGCSQGTIWKRLIEFKISRRKPHELNSKVPTKEELIELYLNKKLSTWKIERLYGFRRGTIHRKLKEFGLNTRDRADSHIIFERKDFSGNLIEKSYIIGFRIGDLGVRKIYPNSKTICVASGSTIPEQIYLIKSLFENYGKIWTQKTKDGKINIQINLNLSFDFLLTKEVPQWVLEDKNNFFSFLAGFTDAEGWIGISKNMACYSLGNCDKDLLELIRNNLIKFGIENRPLSVDKRKGKTTAEGYFFSSDYYSLKINKKKELLNLFIQLKPYIKHKNKIKALNRAIENIEWRNKQFGE